jgi:hypothetical protein
MVNGEWEMVNREWDNRRVLALLFPVPIPGVSLACLAILAAKITMLNVEC